MWLTFYSRLCHRFSSPPPTTHSIDAAQLQRDEDHDDGEELPADRAVQEELQHRAAADLLQVHLLLEHLLQVRPVVPSPPQPPQSCRATVSQVNFACVCVQVCVCPSVCVWQPLSQACWSPLSSSRKRGDSGRKGSVQSCSRAVRPLKPSSQGQRCLEPSSSLQGDTLGSRFGECTTPTGTRRRRGSEENVSVCSGSLFYLMF